MKTIFFLTLLALSFCDKIEGEAAKTKPTPPDIKLPENLRLKFTLSETFGLGVGLDIAAKDNLVKLNLYSDIGDFEHFNLFDFANKTVYIQIGKLCRHFELPSFLQIPFLGTMLSMWSMFANYEGIDKESGFHKYLVPAGVSKSLQAALYFNVDNKKLEKVKYADYEVKVSGFEEFTNVSEIFVKPTTCKAVTETELKSFAKILQGLTAGFQKGIERVKMADKTDL